MKMQIEKMPEEKTSDIQKRIVENTIEYNGHGKAKLCVTYQHGIKEVMFVIKKEGDPDLSSFICMTRATAIQVAEYLTAISLTK